jgi:hypothetical protein
MCTITVYCHKYAWMMCIQRCLSIYLPFITCTVIWSKPLSKLCWGFLPLQLLTYSYPYPSKPLTSAKGKGQGHPELTPGYPCPSLANVVHEHDPLYSLLLPQCYWFSNMIYEVVASYGCHGVIRRDKISSPKKKQEVQIPVNNYLPKIAGHWFGLLVSKISKTMLKIMRAKFEAWLEELIANLDVHFFINLQ